MSLRIDLTDRHENHPESVREYALDKVSKLTRYFDKLLHIEVVLDREHDDHSCEVIVTANNHLRFVGQETHENALASIDRAVDKIERQVVKAKERLKDHHRGDGARKQA